jgi:hypothetical protein
MMKRIAISLIIIMVFCGSAFGANLNLTATWTLNTEPDIKEYRLYRTDGTRTLLGTTPHPNKSSPFTVTVPDGSSGTLLFVVTAVDTSNYESADSNQASYSYNLSATTVTINATDNTATEAGTTTGTFTVSRTGSTSGALTVYYSVSGTATPGSDYNSLSGSVTIASGSSTGTITVTPINDTAVESNETVIVTLSSNAAYTVGSPSSATVTITSDDSAYSAPQGWVFTISNGDTGGATLWFVDGTFEGYGVSFNFETFRMIQGTYNVDAQGLLSGIFTINNLEGVVGPVSGNLIGRVNSDATKMTLVLEDSSKLPVFNMTGLRLLNEPEILGNWGVTISGDATGSFDPLIINSFQDGGEVFSHVFGISGSGIIGSGSVSIQGNFFFTPTIKNKGQENIIYGVYEMTGGINEKGVISGTLNSTKGKFTFNLTSDNGNKYRLVGQ